MFGDYKDINEFKEKCGYEINGFWYPRVTKIIDIKAKPALYRFYAGMENFAAGEKVKQQSAAEGTLVHETVEKLMVGERPEIPSSIAPAVNAFIDFFEHNNIHVDAQYVEKRLCNYEDRYAGTIDAIALIDGKMGVLDIKTSQAIYRDYNLQTSAYLAALKDEIRGLETRWILRIDQSKICVKCGASLRSKGGTDKIKIDWKNPAMKLCAHEWPAEPQGHVELKESPYWQEDFHAFLGAKQLWEWENVEWLKKVGYL